jgi:hypothetical protein
MSVNDMPVKNRRNVILNGSLCSPQLRRHKRQMRIFVEVSGRSQKAIALGMGVPESQLTRWLSDGYPDAMGTQRLEDWTREVGPEYEDWISEQNDRDEDILALESQPPLTLAGMLAMVAGQEVNQLLQEIQAGWDTRVRGADLVGLHKLRTLVDALIAEDEGRAMGGRHD